MKLRNKVEKADMSQKLTSSIQKVDLLRSQVRTLNVFKISNFYGFKNFVSQLSASTSRKRLLMRQFWEYF